MMPPRSVHTGSLERCHRDHWIIGQLRGQLQEQFGLPGFQFIKIVSLTDRKASALIIFPAFGC